MEIYEIDKITKEGSFGSWLFDSIVWNEAAGKCLRKVFMKFIPTDDNSLNNVEKLLLKNKKNEIHINV